RLRGGMHDVIAHPDVGEAERLGVARRARDRLESGHPAVLRKMAPDARRRTLTNLSSHRQTRYAGAVHTIFLRAGILSRCPGIDDRTGGGRDREWNRRAADGLGIAVEAVIRARAVVPHRDADPQGANRLSLD